MFMFIRAHESSEIYSGFVGFKNAGTYVADFDASNLGSGVYSYKLITADYTETKKMMLVK